MQQFIRGQRAKLADLAAINGIWEVGVAIDAPFYIVDYCCLGLDASGEVVDERYLISYNRPDAPGGAISMDNISNNGAVFTVYLDDLPTQIRRLVFTATLHKPEMPGGLLGAAFSFFGGDVIQEIGEGHLTLRTPAVDAAFFQFSGNDWKEESTLILGEIYWRDEWRFVAAGQPYQGELSAFLRTLTDGPTPLPTPVTIPSTSPATVVPPRPPRPSPASPILSPAPVGTRAAIGTRAVELISTPKPVIKAPELQQDDSTSPPSVTPPTKDAASFSTLASFPQTLPPSGKLQDLIDATPTGSTLTLMTDEYQGPIVIRKALTLEGRNSALWAKSGPVITVASSGVILQNLDLEVTVASGSAEDEGVALDIVNGVKFLRLDNVRLKGRIKGAGADNEEWKIPSNIDLGQFAPRTYHEFKFSLRMPVAARLSTSVEGILPSRNEVEPGEHQINLQVDDIAPDTLIIGYFQVSSPKVEFRVPLQGRAF